MAEQKGMDKAMIDRYTSGYDCEFNVFYKRQSVEEFEVIIKEKDCYTGGVYRYAEPSKPGHYAFGGTILFTSNGIHRAFNVPIKLHDRNMDLER